MKVAYFSPMPPERSGIADYSALLLPELRRRIDVDVVRRGSKRGARDADVGSTTSATTPTPTAGSSTRCAGRPGVVVLHDFVLHHLVAGLTIGRRDGHGYLDAMEREGGVVGRLLGHGVLDKRIPPLWENRPEDFHLAGEVLDLATGLIVHSRYVRDRARGAGYRGRSGRSPIRRGRHPASRRSASTAGRSSGPSATSTPQARSAAARGIRRVRGAHPGARSSRRRDIARVRSRPASAAARSRLRGLMREDFVGEERLWALMAACDVVVSLRAPTMGETSGTAIRALTLGKPLVVSDVGWFGELPAAVALKVSVDDGRSGHARGGARAAGGPQGDPRRDGRAARTLAVGEHDVAGSPIATLRRSSRQRAEPPCRRRFSETSRGRRPRSGSGRMRPRRRRSRGGSPRSSLRSSARLRAVPAWAWLVAIVAGSTVFRALVSRGMPGPFIFVDELIYSELAKSFAAGGHFLVRDVPTGGYGLVYPVLISPAYRLFDDIPQAYATVKTLGSLSMSLASSQPTRATSTESASPSRMEASIARPAVTFASAKAIVRATSVTAQRGRGASRSAMTPTPAAGNHAAVAPVSRPMRSAAAPAT